MSLPRHRARFTRGEKDVWKYEKLPEKTKPDKNANEANEKEDNEKEAKEP